MRTLTILCIGLALATGCASKKFVDRELEASETRTQEQIQDLKQMVEETQTAIRDTAKELGLKIEGLETETEAAKKRDDELKQEISDHDEEIAKLGHITFKKTLSEAGAFFKSDSAELNDAAKGELDKFAELIKKQNRMVHIEVQGHTDNRGSEAYNRVLGQKRAEAVRDYLYKSHDIPLHLMSVISMGSEQPLVDNDTRENRSQNRRVVLVVRIKV